MSSTHSHYDVVIIGGGVSGTALFFALSKYTTIKRIALIEKYHQRGQVNSKSTNNSQTLHFGDIETNYSLEKATKVKHKSDMVKHLVHKLADEFPDRQLYSIYNKMIIAVGAKQVAELEKRYESFKTLFPSLIKIGAKEIAQLEPNVMKGRDPNQPIIALSSPEGYTIDYGLLAQTMVESTQINNTDRVLHTMLDTKLKIITRSTSGYHLVTQQGDTTLEIDATMVVVSAGGHTPLIAQSLGYGKHFSILSVAGSFFKSNHHLLNGKVYTMQIPKLPFAAVHG
ncbi:MAG TPA: FAD-dependent oxidoreductase, partial [Candidatus Absconditabacterales bacterium]|nr:FAD-dependent oxidoreductase [Candidatus Absconditabacterales bacterium]